MIIKRKELNTMTSPNEHTLLILGNGFDLSLQIKSKYEDFYKSTIFKNSDSIWSYLIPILVPDAEEANWMDIESAIAKVLIDSAFGVFKSYSNSNMDSALRKINSYSSNYHWIWDEVKIEESIVNTKLPISSHILFLITAKLLKKNSSKKLLRIVEYLSENSYGNISHSKEQPSTKDTQNPSEIKNQEIQLEKTYYHFLSIMAPFLLEELNQLESEFEKYLRQEIGTTERYKKNAIDKLSTLVGSYDSAHITGDKSQVEILNFNYTDLKNVSLRCLDGFNVQNGEKLVSENHDLTYYKKINVENIHGEIDKQNIIFGIDSHDDQKLQNHDFQLLVQPFTKTSRKLRMTESTDFSIRSSYHNIVFFGHSLSDADYSYFEYIFDEVNLYSSNCNLIFKYATAYDSDNAHAIKASVCENVEKLIRRYQDTLPENQQKDLFNRLLIQHRIQIIDIDETKNYEK